MYQGVLKDEARLRDKALSAASAAASSIISPLTHASGSANTPLNTPSSPARGPGVPEHVAVQQPQAVTDEDCDTCRISPPAALLESQSKEARKVEREARELEYRQQRDLAGRLEKEQGVGIGDGRVGGGRLV